MLQLLSGIVLMIMNGRVNDVKQWGKHGDGEVKPEASSRQDCIAIWVGSVCEFNPRFNSVVTEPADQVRNLLGRWRTSEPQTYGEVEPRD